MGLPKIFGANVRANRERLGYSQEELAFRAGLNRAYLSDVERGERNPTIKVVDRIAEGLGVDPSILFHRPAESP
jgi:transcriptional regulator with XRE-family HTH domain